MVAVTFATTGQGDVESVLRDLYTYYLPGVEIPSFRLPHDTRGDVGQGL